MFTRRQIVTHGTVGALAAASIPATANLEAAPVQDNGDVVRELKTFESIVQKSVSSAFETNTLAYGQVPRLRDLFTAFLKTNQKFPDFCEVGINVFYDIYDWHVKNTQPLQVGRNPDNRLTIRFMYTTLIVRADSPDPSFMGAPFDRA